MDTDADARTDWPVDALADPLDAILDQRASDPGGIVAVDVPTVQWVVFSLGGVAFALPGRQVVEILPLVPIHGVPGAPPALAGVIEVRGTIWSVLRLADLLGRVPGPVTRQAAILLGRAADMESGLLVDGVDDVLEVAEDSILAPPADLPGPLHGCVTGVFQHRARAVLALDLTRLFTAWRDGRP
ncbi:chemotaxis protein CheW [uncultured Thiodictyon sp.]|uniref:chemotaxis protein CheW n=1 Tax=uncultured Thiodictyon sp. TaxID=1846217 RepID=UPI0025E450C2|nr:chemotaxis protein CheW [uncultured Thiodictyon sp.]